MSFGELYLTPGSQVSRVQYADGWGTVFRYTEEQWQLILKEVGHGNVRVLWGESLRDVRSVLELIGMGCLDHGTPEQQRAYNDDRKEYVRDLGRAFLSFAGSLKAIGFADEDIFSDEAPESWHFTISEIKRTGEVYARAANSMQVNESSLLVGSVGPRPRGREDQARADYLKRLCDIWADDLGRDVGSSVTEDRIATGPMVRFLIACGNPIFAIRKTSLLTTDGARGVIRQFDKQRKVSDARVVKIQRERRRMAKQLRQQHRVSP